MTFPVISNKTLRVVLIEDKREVRESLAALISGTEGYRCVAAYDMMEAALARIANHQPDIILTIWACRECWYRRHRSSTPNVS